MAGGTIGREMAASYSVQIEGIERTRSELAKLDGVIHQLRVGQYSPVTSVTVASSLGGKDLLVSKLDALEGRVQTATQQAMIDSMDLGRELQTKALRAATTDWGNSGRSKVGQRNGPGRDDSGDMIKAIRRSVEAFKSAGMTIITGWHGWGTEGRGYFPYQEKGTKARKGAKGSKGNRGVPAANSLGQSIIPVRENLKRELDKLR